MKVRVRRAATELKKFLNTLPAGKALSKEQLINTYKEYRKHGTHPEQDIPAPFMAKVNEARKRSQFRKAVVYIRGGKPAAIPIETYMSWLKCAGRAVAAKVTGFGPNGKKSKEARSRKHGYWKGKKNPNCWIKKLSTEARSALGKKAAAARWAKKTS